MRIRKATAIDLVLTALICITAYGCTRFNYAIAGFLLGEAIHDPAPENLQPEEEENSVDPAAVDVHIAVDVGNDVATVVAGQGGQDGDGAIPVTINVTVSEEHEDGVDRQRNGPPGNRPPDRNQNDGDAPGGRGRPDNQGHDHETDHDDRHDSGNSSS